MENNFEKVMSERTDEELIKIVSAEREDYLPEAIEIAEKEIEKRGLNTSEFKEFKENAILEREKQNESESNVANSTLRLVNFIIDSIALLIIGFIISTTYGLTVFILNIEINPTNYSTFEFFSIAIYFFTFFGYYIILESKYQKTLGKMITKTRVVNEKGEKPKLSTITARTIYRLIPFDRLSFLFLKNGIHDMISKTIVIKANKIN